MSEEAGFSRYRRHSPDSAICFNMSFRWMRKRRR